MCSTRAASSCSRRSGGVSTSTVVRPCLPNRSTSSAQRRRRFFGLAGSQLPQTLPTRGTPPEEPQPRMVKRMLMPASAVRGVLA